MAGRRFFGNGLCLKCFVPKSELDARNIKGFGEKCVPKRSFAVMIRTFDSHAHRGAAFASLAHRTRQAATEPHSRLSRTARDMLKMTRGGLSFVRTCREWQKSHMNTTSCTCQIVYFRVYYSRLMESSQTQSPGIKAEDLFLRPF